MKKIFSMIVSILLLTSLAGESVFALPPEFSGGVNNEYEYEEVVFITGQPIKFTGEIDISESEKDDSSKITYKLKLEPSDKSIDGKLTRTITVNTEYTKRNDKGQTIGNATIDKYSEKIEIGSDKYELEDFQFSKSDIIDNRAASDFISGNFKGRKYYTVNKTQGTVTVDISGGTAGYQNFWGETGTNIIDYTIDYEKTVVDDDGDEEDMGWSGTVRSISSDSTSKVLKYSQNEAGLSSFNGGHMRVTSREVTSKYTYSLPDMKNGDGGIDQGDGDTLVPTNKSPEKGSIEISRQMSPKIERLIVPKFRDLSGHWAQSSIEKLYSLDVLEESGDFFSPDVPMTRMEFIKSVMNACNIRPAMVEEKRSSRSKKQPVEESVFEDMSVKDEDYAYVKDAYEKGIIQGEQSGKFNPDMPLTRAQAITILIRALGFEGKAPTPGYYSGFSDDSKIPAWAKASVYMAKETGLVTGDEQGRLNPNIIMTRSEASVMIVRFLEFLQRDLQRDYREDIVNFN